MAARTKSKITPKYKTKYRVKNWRAYEAALRKRGDITVWFGQDAIDAWNAPPGGRPGGQQHEPHPHRRARRRQPLRVPRRRHAQRAGRSGRARPLDALELRPRGRCCLHRLTAARSCRRTTRPCRHHHRRTNPTPRPKLSLHAPAPMSRLRPHTREALVWRRTLHVEPEIATLRAHKPVRAPHASTVTGNSPLADGLWLSRSVAGEPGSGTIGRLNEELS